MSTACIKMRAGYTYSAYFTNLQKKEEKLDRFSLDQDSFSHQNFDHHESVNSDFNVTIWTTGKSRPTFSKNQSSATIQIKRILNG